MNMMPDDLIWRRVIKASIVHLTEDTQNSIFWMGKLIKPLRFSLDFEYVQFQGIQDMNFDWSKREDFYYKMDDLDPEVMPGESMSALMRQFKIYPSKYRAKTPATASYLTLLEGSIPKKKTYDYHIEDANITPTDTVNNNNNTGPDTLESSFSNPMKEDPKKRIKKVVDDELKNLNRSEQ